MSALCIDIIEKTNAKVKDCCVEFVDNLRFEVTVFPGKFRNQSYIHEL